MQGFFRGRIGQAKPLLHELNVKDTFDLEGRAAALGACVRRREWLDQTHQFPQETINLIKNHTLARAPNNKLESAGGKADFFISFQRLLDRHFHQYFEGLC